MATKTTAATTKKKRAVKAKVEKRPDSGAEKRAAAVDPFDTTGVAPNAAPTTKKGDNVYTADPEKAALIDRFMKANGIAKKAKAEADTAKGELLDWATGEFAEQYCTDGSRPKNPVLKGETTAPKLIYSDAEVKVDDGKWATLQDLFDDADDAVTIHESFAFKPDFLDEGDNKARIRAALAAAFTPEEVAAMIEPTVRRTTKKGSIDRVLGLLGENVGKGGVQLALSILTKAPSIR